MSGSLRLGLLLLAIVVGGYIVVKLTLAALNFLMPVLIIAGVVLVVGGLLSRKALGGGRRTLP